MISITDRLTAEDFTSKFGKSLERNEVENNVILGVLSNLLQKPPSERQDHYLLAAEEPSQFLGAAIWTPPFKFGISRMPDGVVDAVADHLWKRLPFLPGVSGPAEAALRFSQAWSAKSGKPSSLERSERFYQLTQVIPPPEAPGKMRNAVPADLVLLSEWSKNFTDAIKVPPPKDHKKNVADLIRAQRLLVWENGEVVAMAGFSGLTANGARVSGVYTPPAFRSRGYASSLVASVSRKLLGSGKKFCVLFADQSNPTSNGIYQRMGYRPVCDWAVYRF